MTPYDKRRKEVQEVDPELRQRVYMAGYTDGWYSRGKGDCMEVYNEWVKGGCHEPSDNA